MNAKLMIRLPIFAAVAISGPAHGMGAGGPFEGIKLKAMETTLALETPASSGSAVLIGSAGSTYYFLTAGHVVPGDAEKEEFYVYSANKGGKKYRVMKFERPNELKGLDLVIGSFKSNDKLELALIFALDEKKGVLPSAFGEKTDTTDRFATIDQWIKDGRNGVVIPQELPPYNWIAWKSFNGRTLNKEWGIQGPPIVAGVSLPTKAIPLPLMRSTSAEIVSRIVGNKDGYELIYTSQSTVPGMSGGGVYGARVCPAVIVKRDAETKRTWEDDSGLYAGLVAIHGRSEEYANSGGRSGVSLGVPMILIRNYLISNARRMGIPVGKRYADIVLKTCVNESFDE